MSKPKLRHLTLLTSTANSSTIKKEVRVEMSKFARKQIDRLPSYIAEDVFYWMDAIVFQE